MSIDIVYRGDGGCLRGWLTIGGWSMGLANERLEGGDWRRDEVQDGLWSADEQREFRKEEKVQA